MKEGDKKEQFFLLAAVIISVVVLSLGATVNRARVTKEPSNFYDYGYSLKESTGELIDYQIYNKFSNPGDNLTKFVQLLGKDARDKDKNIEFIVLYGNYSSVSVENHGKSDIWVNCSEGIINVPGATGTSSSVSLPGVYLNVSSSEEVIGKGICTDGSLGNQIEVGLMGRKYYFSFSKDRQVVFIVQKNQGGESFVAVN